MKTTEVQAAIGALCAITTACFPTGHPKATRLKWLSTKEVYIGFTTEGDRIMVPITFTTDEYRRPFLMDAVTGTVYRIEDGKCMTSDTLRLISHRKDKDQGKRLFNLKATVKGNVYEQDVMG